MRLYESRQLTIDKMGGAFGGEAYLVQSAKRSLLFDSGFAFSAPWVIAGLEEALGEHSLDYLVHSHSHYDHVSGSCWIKRRWPEAQIVGHAHAAQVFARPGARELMRQLNEEALREHMQREHTLRECALHKHTQCECAQHKHTQHKHTQCEHTQRASQNAGAAPQGVASAPAAPAAPAAPETTQETPKTPQGATHKTTWEGSAARQDTPDTASCFGQTFDFSPLEELTVERIVQNGDCIEVGDVRFEVIETPGHTKDCIMLWCATERLLLSSETLGVLSSNGRVGPCYLTSYQGSLDALAKARSLEPEHLLIAHHRVVSGSDVTRFFDRAEASARQVAHLVWSRTAEGLSEEEISEELAQTYYLGEETPLQPRKAYDINTSHMIRHLISLMSPATAPPAAAPGAC